MSTTSAPIAPDDRQSERRPACAALFDRVAERAISCPSLDRHSGQQRDSFINVVNDQNFRFPFVLAVQPPHILGQSPLPRYGHGQEERIEPLVIETLTNITPPLPRSGAPYRWTAREPPLTPCVRRQTCRLSAQRDCARSARNDPEDSRDDPCAP